MTTTTTTPYALKNINIYAINIYVKTRRVFLNIQIIKKSKSNENILSQRWETPKSRRNRLSHHRETFKQIAGDFPNHGKPSNKLQGTFPTMGNLQTNCRGLSHHWETSKQIAGDFPNGGKPSNKLRGTFPTVGKSKAFKKPLLINIFFCTSSHEYMYIVNYA